METAYHSRSAAVALRDGRSGVARVVPALLWLALAVTAAYVLLVAVGLLDTSLLERLGLPVERWLAQNEALQTASRAVAAGVALGLGLVALLLASRSLGGGAARSSASHTHILSADERGVVVVDSRGICNVAAAAVRRVAGVADVAVQVRGQGAAPLQIQLRLWVSAAAELKRVGDEARRKAADAVERLVGIDVHDVGVKLEVLPLEELGRNLR